nr:MAG TPA: hypothetical protein [Caudoviricetes sp.]
MILIYKLNVLLYKYSMNLILKIMKFIQEY